LTNFHRPLSGTWGREAKGKGEGRGKEVEGAMDGNKGGWEMTD